MGGDYLRELLVTARSLGELSGDVVRRLLLRGDRRKFPLIKPQEEEGFDLTQAGDKQKAPKGERRGSSTCDFPMRPLPFS